MKFLCTNFYFLFLSSVIFFPNTTFAQTPKAQKEAPIGTVIGIVRDSANGNAVEFAVITILAKKDSLAKGGGLTDKTGSFSINKIPAGEYFARCSFMGYKTFYSKTFFITNEKTQFDGGIIRLVPDKHTMSTVDIVEEKSDYNNSVDKKVYEVAKNATTTGGTATDVLQTIPGVSVDIDGNVSMRGSGNVTILIDGKPSGLTGDDKNAVIAQIPASMIERIEIISNPSARYDAQGMSGIINIITKKDNGKGFNGSATIGAGTNNKYNAALQIGSRSKKINLIGNYTFRSEEKWSTNDGMQHTFPTDTNYYYQFIGGGISNNLFQNGKMAADIFLNAYNTLSLSTSATLRNEKRSDSTNYAFLDEQLNPFSGFQRKTWNDENTQSIDATADYKKMFPGSKKLLTASGSFSGSKRINESDFANDFNGLENPPYQSNTGVNEFRTITGQADYVLPFNDSMRLEMGAKYGLRHNNNLQQAKTYNYSDSAYYFDAKYSDHFIFSENIYAAYVQFAAHVRKVDYQAGVRSEFTDLSGASGSTGLKFSNKYVSLFPSAALRYSPKEGYDFRFTYSRRLNRPNNQQINPFIDYSDSISIRTGNPYLQPEFIHSLETEFVKSWTQVSLSAALYYRHTDNMISMSRIFDTLTGHALAMPRNFSTSDNIGMDIILRWSIGRKGNVLFTLSGNDSKINGDNIQAGLQSTALGWSSKVSASYKIFKTTSLQLSGNYNSPWANPLGTFQMPGGIDLGVRQDLFKNKATFTLNVSDVFSTKKMIIHNYYSGYDFNGNRKRESRILMITFSWRFGKGEEEKKKNTPPIPQQPDDSQQQGF